MKIAGAWFVACSILLAPGLSDAQVRYKDDDGVWHFVNSIDEVPAKYRGAAAGRPVAPGSPSPSPATTDWERKAKEADARRDQEKREDARRREALCTAGVEALAARQGGKFTRYDIRRELGADCEEQTLATLKDATKYLEICADRYARTTTGMDPNRRMTKAEVLAAAGPECRAFVEWVWHSIQEDRQK